jgi:wyosine [tRNA(Phe)-imidazoG37] synthetase (radical SAM superfamily)
MEGKKYLFGPVPSRRFGRSLGVDLTPHKTCSLDCVFCQLGRTDQKTITRKEYVPVDDVLAELREWMKTDGMADYITLSGSGEPTLHSRFGEVLEFIRTNSAIPTVLLTNATMLSLPEVREAARFADIVKISLSAWHQASYAWVNRPHKQLRFDALLEGQKAFRREFKGQLWMEVFLVSGMNTIPEDVKKMAALAEEIRPDRIHLNTAVRPPSEVFALPVTKKQLVSLSRLFHPTAEVIAEFKTQKGTRVDANKDTIMSMLQRRPCTANQIASAFGMHPNEVSKYLGNLLNTDQIQIERKDTGIYYRALSMKDKTPVGL